MPRNCNCAGPCGPAPEDDDENGVSRRDFLTGLGTGLIALAPMGGGAQEEGGANAAPQQTLEEWKRALQAPAPTRIYRSGVHRDVRFPLGGIGTGSFELGADGQFTTWQLFNTLRDGHVPFFFGIHAGGKGMLLQTTGGPPGLPTVPAIEMTGEYPLAVLRYPGLPVRVEMTAFTPLVPLDSAVSSLPTACFVFRLYNPGKKAQTVSLGAFLQNPVGYDAFGSVQSFNTIGFNAVPARWDNRHPNFGGNHNEKISGEKFVGVLCGAKSGGPATVSPALRVYTNANPAGLNAHPVDHAAGFTVQSLDQLPASPGAEEARSTAIWIENAGLDLSEETLTKARNAVRQGATLVVAGTDSPLMTLLARQKAPASPAPADIVFEDFESGYARWKVDGEAFGTAPVTGTLPNQQTVTGHIGKGLVNSFLRGDDTTGKLTSRNFAIERRYIRFLVGGGEHTGTQVRLVIDGKVARRQSGRNNERLLPAVWDVGEFRGKTARIEIVDEQTGPWGHINVDQIEFGDAPVSGGALAVLADLLPATLSTAAAYPAKVAHGALFESATPRPDASPTPSGSAAPNLKFLTRKIGAGKSVLASGPLLAARDAELIGARQAAFAALAGLAGVTYARPQGVPTGAPGLGTLALGTQGGDKQWVAEAFEDWASVWNVFAKTGTLPASPSPSTPTPPGRTVNAAVAASVPLPPGKTVEIPFFLTWRYPNRYGDKGQNIGNHYATRWPDAGAVLRDVVKNFAALRDRTALFHKTLYDSTLPYWLLDAVTSQISTIRHPGVVFQLPGGDLYGWEGSNGCCPPTCTHVWGYEQTLAYLFPDLERTMRRIDFRQQQNPDGGINNRTEVPSPGHPTGERPFSDGHASCILKIYREARNQTDPAYLTTYWPRIRAAVDYLIAQDAASSPDEKPDGTLSGDQWNTYDNAIHGVNTFIGTYYLGALRAGEEMARRADDRASADRFRAVFESGRKNLMALCWNGEYFEQHLPDYLNRAGEYGKGCLSDQVIGQWWAHQLGLGDLLPREQVRAALRAVFKYNWRTDHTGFQHNWRKFAGGTDKGLLICTWPRGGRPANTIPYVDEVWTGIEYQVAAHMLYEGMTDEAYAIIKGVRDRYDGIPRAPMPRNPWNEIECGGHYARAMSSWSLLLALSGWGYDSMTRALTLTPPRAPGDFRGFFSSPQGWGTLTQEREGADRRKRIALHVREGRFDLASLSLEEAAVSVQSVEIAGPGGKPVRFSQDSPLSRRSAPLRFAAPGVTVSAGQSLIVNLAAAAPGNGGA